MLLRNGKEVVRCENEEIVLEFSIKFRESSARLKGEQTLMDQILML